VRYPPLDNAPALVALVMLPSLWPLHIRDELVEGLPLLRSRVVEFPWV
jgi:hypothetical protein